MVSIRHVATFDDTNAAFLTGVGGSVLHETAQGPVLYLSTGLAMGMTTLRVEADGLSLLDREGVGGNAVAGMAADLALLDLPEGVRLMSLGRATAAPQALAIAPQGGLSAPQDMSFAEPRPPLAEAVTIESGGSARLYAVHAREPGLRIYGRGTDGLWTESGSLRSSGHRPA